MKMIKKKGKKNLPSKILICPQCGGTELYYENALITGYKYHCKDCDYIGALVLEKDVEDMEEAKESAS